MGTGSFTDACTAKFGVKTDEFEDGIVIYGRPLASLKHSASIHCCDDYRVTMAFSPVCSHLHSLTYHTGHPS